MSRDPEIILCTQGTKGDFLPFLALARELMKRRREVVILSNSNWADLAAGAGAPFLAIAPADPTQSGRDDLAFFEDYALPAHRKTFDFVTERVRGGRPTLLIYQPFMLGAECAAIKYRLPNVKVALQPLVIKSRQRPPWPLTALAEGPLGAISKRTLIPFLCEMSRISGLFRRYLRRANAFRKSVGVATVSWTRPTESPEDMILVMCPTWFAMPQDDWPAECRVVGFPFFDQGHADDAVDSFIEKRGPPLVFTPGTGVIDISDFFARAARVCEILGFPGIFLSPAAPPADETKPPFIMRRDFIPLEGLLPRARLLVHHGGIGTTAQAIRAGIPQIIFPDRFDQPDNAMRVAQLRLGAAVMSEKIKPTTWADLVRTLLTDDCTRRRLALASQSVKAQDATRLAADLVEDLIARRFGPGRVPRVEMAAEAG